MGKKEKKPEQVLWLEQQLGFELREVKNLDYILSLESSRSYVLDSNKEIVGLSICRQIVTNYSFLLSLSKIMFLNLHLNNIENCNFLRLVKSLSHLVLSCNQVKDISSLGVVFSEAMTTLYLSQVLDLKHAHKTT